MNNAARIVKIHAITKHSNADNLQIVNLFGTQVITDLTTKEGDLMIYFDSNLQLSPEYLNENNLYRTVERNKDPLKKGYFDDNGRVKAIKLRGEFSDGMLMPLDSLNFTQSLKSLDLSALQEGTEFQVYNNIPICSKYVIYTKFPPEHTGEGKRKKRRKSIISPMFVEHWDTAQYMRSRSIIPAGTLCYIEEKIHGTSNRTANVLISKPVPKIKTFLSKLIGIETKYQTRYQVINGTRRTTITRLDSVGYHESSIRDDLYLQIKDALFKGEEIYCEIAGYEKSGRHIQKDFPYGAEPGKCRYFMYRGTLNNEDGYTVDYSRTLVYNRAKELGLETPPLLTTYYFTGSAYSMKRLDDLVISLAQGQSALDEKTLREGVVVWFIDKRGKWNCLKYKSDKFKLKESNLKDQGIGDIEDML